MSREDDDDNIINNKIPTTFSTTKLTKDAC